MRKPSLLVSHASLALSMLCCANPALAVEEMAIDLLVSRSLVIKTKLVTRSSLYKHVISNTSTRGSVGVVNTPHPVMCIEAHPTSPMLLMGLFTGAELGADIVVLAQGRGSSAK